jgi:Cdc6-like AAA superfamily ATPase
MMAVNAAVTLERPILVKGEPGTGKTQLAVEVANALGKSLFEWHIKSTTKAQQGLYEYDAVARLRDSQLGDDRVHDIANYIQKGKIWEAFASDEQPVLLIDEIDKADIEFPNDLLRELDRMEFYVYETKQLVAAKHRPIIVITSNNVKELTDARGSRRSRRRQSCSTGSSCCWPKTSRRKRCVAPTSARPSHRFTVRCSRTSRMCICSSAWCSWIAALDSNSRNADTVLLHAS